MISHLILCGGLPDEASRTGEVRLRVGGISDDHHLEWVNQRLALGDTLEIRLIETTEADPPATRIRVTEAEHERLRIASSRPE